MMRPTFTKFSARALMFIITAAIGADVVESKSEPGRLTISQSAGISPALMAPGNLFMRPCRPRSTVGGRLTRRTDVFGDEVPQYRPVKGEQVFLWNADGDEIARTRTDRNGDYSFPNLCPGAYTVHPGIFSPRLPSRFDPESRSTTVPIRINEVGSPLHLDFVKKQPPPPRQPDFQNHRRAREEYEVFIDHFRPRPCVERGTEVIIYGSRFGRRQAGRLVVLGGHGISAVLRVTEWRDGRITAIVHNYRRIEQGQWYYIGLQDEDRHWISNISRTINICRRLE